MGCNCKSGKTQKLNNLDSSDHLQLAFDVYHYHIKDKPVEYEYDDVEKNIFIETYRSVYPNVKVEVNYQHALDALKKIYEQYYGRK